MRDTVTITLTRREAEVELANVAELAAGVRGTRMRRLYESVRDKLREALG